MAEQQSFLGKTWGVGDRVIMGDQQGVIKKFDTIKNKVMIEFRDMHDGDTNMRLYSIDELPAYVPKESTKNDAVDSGSPVIAEDDDMSTADSTSPSPVEASGNKEIEQAKPEADEEEIVFEKGHKRVNKTTGSTLTVVEPSVRGKYICRMTLDVGGTFENEKTWQQIAEWGEAVVEKKTEAVAEDNQSKEETPPPLPPENVTLKQKYETECRVEPFAFRDGDGFHHAEAGKRLTELINDGWKLMHLDYQTIWIPAKNAIKESYVETTVIWTLSRTRGLIGEFVT